MHAVRGGRHLRISVTAVYSNSEQESIIQSGLQQSSATAKVSARCSALRRCLQNVAKAVEWRGVAATHAGSCAKLARRFFQHSHGSTDAGAVLGAGLKAATPIVQQPL